jgi:hypothetical protein
MAACYVEMPERWMREREYSDGMVDTREPGREDERGATIISCAEAVRPRLLRG